MNKKEFLRLVETSLDSQPSSISEDDLLDALGWDSLAVVGFIAAVDEKTGITLSPQSIEKCKTVGDLAVLLGNEITD